MRKRITVLILLVSMVALAVFPMEIMTQTVSGPPKSDAYIVVFNRLKLPGDAEAIIDECGGRVAHKCPDIGVLVAVPVTDPAAFEGMLAQRPEIVDFGPDFIAEVPDDIVVLDEGTTTPVASGPMVTDPYYWTYQWHMWHAIDASPDKAWAITTGTHDTKVAVMDTGIDYNHPDLAPNYDFALSKSFVDWDFDGVIDEDEMDYNGHGSHCGGVVAAAINNDPNDAKVVGVGPDLGLVNLKVMGAGGTGYFSWSISAIYYAVENGIDVVSMSFGAYVPKFDQGGSALFNALTRLFNYADKNGIVCIASAGNSGLDMDGLYSWVHLPSQCSHVISVIGTDIYNGIAHVGWASNYGSCLQGISAPGGDAAFVEPEWYKDIIPPEYWWYVYGYVFSTYAWTTTGYKYAWMGGTSMAAPHVAGVAGLILSKYPGTAPNKVRVALNRGATDIGDPGYDQYFNHGLVNAYKALTVRPLWLPAKAAPS